ncbi:unnamed protein product [Leptidea sinapis]|uniref:DUF4378 domain-containing protein n=1 Tax=Leptidea sinapis TaxID=189913 RepID=A0A5E4PK40_9NEOP|nr:unnamed protein product [Leptidea sinapis]
MNKSMSVESDKEYNKLCNAFVELKKPEHIGDIHRTTVVKYTRIPDFPYDSKLWSESSFSEPRLRRLVAIQEPQLNTTRSLKSFIPKMSTPTQQIRSSHSKLTSRAVETDFKEKKLYSHRTTSRLLPSARDAREVKKSIKSNSPCKKEVSMTNLRTKQSKPDLEQNLKAREVVRNTKNVTRESLSKKIENNKITEDKKTNASPKHITKVRPHKSTVEQKILKEINECHFPLPVVYVPLEVGEGAERQNDPISSPIVISNLNNVANETVNQSTDVQNLTCFSDMNVGTDLQPKSDKCTQSDNNLNVKSNLMLSQTMEDKKDTFGSLEVPNVTLVKHKVEKSKENIVTFCSQSMPNLKVPAFSDTNLKSENKVSDTCYRNTSSYIISRATLTYTTKQKIDFHVVENQLNLEVRHKPVVHPMSVISVYRKELKERNANENYENGERCTGSNAKNRLNHLTNPKVIPKRKLIKPSFIIGAINLEYNLVPNDNIIDEQFQRELHFIDTFFESLQYLESCSLAEKRLTQSSLDELVNNVYDLKKVRINNFSSKLDNDIDSRETMASKSLCLLNLLIRDEQRRAKNLLFVLKMREEALKDFTKSHILWLENRKKQDNIDIPTLKKKQRGALLKLQYECGEMQRMRKALLTLSEKRKLALMKTKRNIELKLKSHVDVKQITFDKKKLKRSTSTDRNIPLKCFELSSSGCEESTTSRPKSTTPVCFPKVLIENLNIIEKSVQTVDNIVASVDHSTSTDENFVVVDGGYLNILFRNLSLPEIFSSERQYEVNEEAIKSIVTKTNDRQAIVKESDVIKKFMDQITNSEAECSSSPSTARSLVDELDEYYKVLKDDDKSEDQSFEAIGIVEIDSRDVRTDAMENKKDSSNRVQEVLETSKPHSECPDCAWLHELPKCLERKLHDEVSANVAGPLPVPPGAADVVDPSPQLWPHQQSTTSSLPVATSNATNQILYSNNICSYTSPTVESEAEELRRQQLEIEREIKALEQQQCQLLAVREIPDKPPPPYIPPVEIRNPKENRKYHVDCTTEAKIRRCVENIDDDLFDESDPFELFVKDFCLECVECRDDEKGITNWFCQSLATLQVDHDKFPEKTVSELSEVLKGVAPTVVTGVGTRRSDHIDDILFAEWRRCEPDWTSLHKDEVIVKNQLFESIFQKILSETVDEYKNTVSGSGKLGVLK